MSSTCQQPGIYVYPLVYPEWLEKWTLQTNVWCHWCCHPHNNVPIPLPVRRDPRNSNKFWCQGLFCSFNCAKACAISMKGEYNNHGTSLVTSFLRQMKDYFEVPHMQLEPPGWLGLMGSRGGIKSANPRQSLIVFGGDLTIEKFRSGFITVTPVILSSVSISNNNNHRRRWVLNMQEDEEEDKDKDKDGDEVMEDVNMIRSMTTLIAVTNRQHFNLHDLHQNRVKQQEQKKKKQQESKNNSDSSSAKDEVPKKRGRKKKEPVKVDEVEDCEETRRQTMQANIEKRRMLIKEAQRKKRIEDATERVEQINNMKRTSEGLVIRKNSSLSACLNIEVSYQDSL